MDERWRHGKRRGPALTWAAAALLLVATCIVSAADTAVVRWITMATLLLGIFVSGLLLRRRLHRAERRNEWLQAILDSVPHILSYKDVSLRYRGVNRTFEQTFDVRAGDVVVKNDAEMFGQALHDRFAAQDREILETGQTRTFYEEIPVDGRIRYMESRRAPFYDDRGAPLGVVALAVDVTEHQQLRQQLEVSNARLNVALRAAQTVTWAWNSETDEIDLDAPARKLFGIGEGRYKAAELAKGIHPDDIEPLREAVRRALREGVAVDYEFRGPTRRGGWYWVQGSAIRHCVPGKSTHLIGVNRDITLRKQQELELAEAKQRAEHALSELKQSRTELDLALRSGRFGVWHSTRDADAGPQDQSDQPVDWDANVRRIFGLSAGELVTRRQYFEALHPEDRERVLAGLAEVYHRDVAHADHQVREYSDQYRIVRPDGSIRVIAVSAAPSFGMNSDTGRRQFRMTGIIRDITEEENLKADLRKKALEAQLAAEAKARFLAMMSHEIRTPMNGVVGMVELLLETPLSFEQQQMLKTCKDSAFVLLTVLNDILDFSKIEAGKLELDYVRLSPRRLVESVGEALGIQATQRGIDLDMDIAPEVPRRVIGDRVRLRQILINLVSNAIKFTEQGGVVVTVSLERCDPSDERTHVRFDVADSGIGMDEETVRSLFQPFQQADAATTRRFGGTGLGLSIVKHLTELMGGRVECESQLLQGSRLSVVIPFETAVAGEPGESYPIAGVRILALAAQGLRRRILSDFMAQSDAGIEFSDSADALVARARQAVVQGSVDVILLDRGWSTSECAGLRRRFSEIPELARLPFVVVRSNESVQVQLIPDATLINGNPLTRASLGQGIAVAMGRIGAPVPVIATGRAGDPMEPLSRDREETAGRLILLAEDNATNRDVISRQLAQLGYVCDLAEDGARALTMLKSGATRYALLLTDCHMPRLDGYELTRRIRANERSKGTPALPIIAITANVLQGEGERCLAMGMNGYLAKPMQIGELKRILSEFLPLATTDPMQPGPSLSGEPVRFRELAEILGNDEGKLRYVLGVFERSTRSDWDLLEAAYAAGDRALVYDLAHKLKSGCSQLGENLAALALEALEDKAKGHAGLDDEFVSARRELQQVLTHVGAYLATRSI